MEKLKSYLSGRRWLAIALAILILGVISSILSPSFLKLDNFRGILMSTSITGIMAIGMTFVILTGGIDISVSGIIYLTACIFCTLINNTGSFLLALAMSLLCGCVTGLLNGFLVYRFNMTPMITTLATYYVYRGLGLVISGGLNISVPREYTFLGNGSVIGIPIPMILMVAIIAIGIAIFLKTRFGVYTMAIGNSRQSAMECHLPVNKTLIGAYFLAGITASIGGIILVSRTGGLQGELGRGMEFTIIAAVVLGGTKLVGGSGTMLGSVLGAIFLVMIDNILTMMEVSPYVFDAVRGIILLLAVSADRFSALRQLAVIREQKSQRIRQTS